jgi:hypothetical protein
MPGNNTQNTALGYPDVLGMVTGGIRHHAEVVQCAFAVHPTSITVGQALEALVLIQNACDRPIHVRLHLSLPRKDVEGNRISLVAAKEMIPLDLHGGEVGLLHVPIIPFPPTAPGEAYVVGVRLEPRAPRGCQQVHGPHGGRPASILNISPFRLNILREARFSAEMEGGYLVRTFNILPGAINAAPGETAPRYEVLWSARELPQEQARYQALSEQAAQYAGALDRAALLAPLRAVTEQRYASAGLPLHPAEALFIAKTLTYAMEDGLHIESAFDLRDSRWFQRLVTVAADRGLLDDVDALVAFLYTAVVRDAVRLGLLMVERESGQGLGSAADHLAYADEVMLALERQQGIDLGHAYLPLILAGLLIHNDVKDSRESLWDSLTHIREAWRGRVRLAGSQYEWVARLLSDFSYAAEQRLFRAGVPRPPSATRNQNDGAAPAKDAGTTPDGASGAKQNSKESVKDGSKAPRLPSVSPFIVDEG